MLKGLIEFVMDVFETITFIGSFFIVTYLFILQPNQIKGRSMMQTFLDKQYILTSKITYKFREPERGDVVVFNEPHAPGEPRTGVEYIKRIIGLPGDVITITANGVVKVNNTVLDEHMYINNQTNLTAGWAVKDGEPYTVPEGYYFMMGDNRQQSQDSRAFGAIKKSEIIGQVFYRYFPTSKAGKIVNPWKESMRKGPISCRLIRA